MDRDAYRERVGQYILEVETGTKGTPLSTEDYSSDIPVFLQLPGSPDDTAKHIHVERVELGGAIQGYLPRFGERRKHKNGAKYDSTHGCEWRDVRWCTCFSLRLLVRRGDAGRSKALLVQQAAWFMHYNGDAVTALDLDNLLWRRLRLPCLTLARA